MKECKQHHGYKPIFTCSHCGINGCIGCMIEHMPVCSAKLEGRPLYPDKAVEVNYW